MIMQGESLTDTAKKSICEQFDSWQRNVRYEIKSKYLDKGIRVEEESINMTRLKLLGAPHDLKGKRIYDKFKKYDGAPLENDFLVGTPDILFEDVVIDVKSSWSRATWLFSVAELKSRKINPAYFYQLQAYMWLSNKYEAYLSYCLVNTPPDLIYNDSYELHHYEIPIVDRVYLYKISLEDKIIAKIEKKCKMANEFIDRYLLPTTEINMSETEAHNLIFGV